MPAVLAVDGGDLIMERLHGRDMLADLASRPWRTARHARTLAALHDRLHQIAAPRAYGGRSGPAIGSCTWTCTPSMSC